MSASANAAGLGKLTVLSSLGQPLRAEIELTAVTPEEAGELAAKLASPEAFRQANIDFNPALLSLKFDVEQRNGRQFIRVSSSQPINEPFVDMLLELSWTNGRLVREYTFLLDPADLRSAQAPQAAPAAAAPTAAVAAPAAPTAAERAAAVRASRPAPAASPAASQAKPAAEEEYRVKQGDTLGRIARQLKPSDVSLDMMLVALYRANPEAFSGKNMNRLKSGTILRVPDADSARATAQGEAHGVVVAHAADFNAYRAKLAGQVASSTPAKEPEAAQSATGKISARVEEHAKPASEAKDKLKLSKAGEQSARTGKTGSAEDKIAKDQQVAEASERVKELEKNVSDLEKLMAVKSKAATEAQNKASAPAKPEASAAASAKEQAAAASAEASASAGAASAASEAAAKPAKPPRSVVGAAKSPVQEPSLVETLTENAQYIGVALAALLGGAFMLARRRKQQKAETAVPPEESSVLGDPGVTAPAMFAEAGGQSVDTSNSVFNSNFAPSASQLDTNEVDPVAEADVYIAYGRDAQAEEILKEALRNHPERHPVRLKLLEIYANRRDTRAFEAQASELYSQTSGEGEEWAQAAQLGRGIDPANPLYAGAAAATAGGEVAAGLGLAAAGAAGAAALADDDLSIFAAPAPAEAAAEEGLDLDLSKDATALAAQADSGLDFAQEQTALPAEPAPAAETPDWASPGAAAAEPAWAQSAAKPESDPSSFLDFDLGGLSFDQAAAPAPAAAETVPDTASSLAEESKAAPDLGLALDMPFESAAAPAPAPADDLGMDFNLDLPSDTPAPVPAPAAEPEALADLDMMDFDLPASAPAPIAAPTIAAPDLDDLRLPDIEDMKPATAAATALPDIADMKMGDALADAPAPAPADFDLSGIDLDLHGAAAQPAEALTAAPVASEEALSAHHMEMDTKLDLAIAYQEIGDKEGARELLDEVIRGGNDDQVGRASSMRALLG
ncbi:LysM peptidoglycan-binding domain-containing protein [Massilia sp. MB5]|uniref:FimV/HubP family polar landmark protein n=1 Tax=Massilia sp. MB5 TaxID=2919578 RepID=UPI001F0DC3F8|nr:FimV/HubP family polar landmark protein [Massilia sp. MB5]UMR30597.1 LysM peptidoglycan-binding domain-containing protein [Massilia sp. MB5]